MSKRINIHRINKSIPKQKGMTFIEVLIALVIMVTGILGAVAMQATAKKGSFDTMQRSLASSLAQDIVERMRGNDATALVDYGKNDYGTGAYIGSKVADCATNVGCNPTQMRSNDQYEWERALMGADVTKNTTSNVGGLVGGLGCVTVAANAVTVVITWQGKAEYSDAKQADSCGTSSSTRRQVVVEAFIL
jgi:type IV pilus assembly protein PilV